MVFSPLQVGQYTTAWNNTTPKSVSVNVKNGDLLVVTSISRDYTVVPSVPTNTGTSQSWTLVQQVGYTGYTYMKVYKCQITTAQALETMSISVSSTGTDPVYGFDVEQWRFHAYTGASAQAHTTGAPSLALTTLNDTSAVQVAVSDWVPVDGTSRTWRTGAGALTEKLYNNGGRCAAYIGYHLNAGTAGSKTVGLTAPTGQTYDIVAMEIKGIAARTKAATLLDDFTLWDTTSWGSWNGSDHTVGIVSGELSITTGAALTTTDIFSNSYHDLTSSYALLKTTISAQRTDLNVSLMQIWSETGTNGITLSANAGLVDLAVTVNGVATYPFQDNYTSAWKWVRFREASGTFYVDRSPDGARWVTAYSMATPFTMTSVKFWFGVACWSAGITATTIKYDNFNIPNAAPKQHNFGTPIRIGFGPNGPQKSGAAGSGVPDGTFATWRGTAVPIVGTWNDDAEAHQYQWSIISGGEYENWQGDIDNAIGGLYPANGETWALAAAGNYDTRWGNVLTTIKNARAGKSGTMYIRPFHEMNGDWTPWMVNSANAANFITAWRRFRALQQSIYPESKLVMSLNDGTSSSLTLDWRNLFPGPSYVDLMGVDSYNQDPWVNTANDFRLKINAIDGTGAPLGVEKHRQFAESQGLPLAITEWNSNGVVGDAAIFMQLWKRYLNKYAGTGAGQIPFEIVFNVPSYGTGQFGLYPTTLQPNAAAAYVANW